MTIQSKADQKIEGKGNVAAMGAQQRAEREVILPKSPINDFNRGIVSGSF